MDESKQALELLMELPDSDRLLYMDDYNRTLQLQILQELPDPEQQLSAQHDSSFIRFKQLPDELQHMIWKLCFPRPRSVLIGEGRPGRNRTALGRRRRRPTGQHRRRVRGHYLPATLGVCSLSQKLTLESYSIIRWKDLEEDFGTWTRNRTKTADRKRPICFDHKRDSLYVLCGRQQSHLSFFDWMTKLNSLSKGRLAEVTKFEIRGFYHSVPWRSELTLERERWKNADWIWPQTREATTGLYPLSEPALDGLFVLCKLRLVRFSIHFDKHRYSDLDSSNCGDAYQDHIWLYLGLHGERFESHDPLRVVVDVKREDFAPE